MDIKVLVIILGVGLAATAAVGIARRIAIRISMLDVPNERSSHKLPVPRLGGAAFMPVVLLGVALCWGKPGLPGIVRLAFFAGAVVLYGISLIDDFRSVPALIRFGVQFTAAMGALGAVYSSCGGDAIVVSNSLRLSAIAPPSSAFWLLTLWIVGFLNVYNFMDGIDGIAGVQAIAAGVAWCAIAAVSGAPQSGLLAACVAAGALGFLTLNWPPARIFMGDAGSTVLGYIFAILPLLVMVETGAESRLEPLLLAAGLVVWPFLTDATFTILRRLKNRENIFKAHRSHLYQRLVIAGVGHRTVTCVYGVLAVIGGVLAWRVAIGAPGAAGTAAEVVGVAFVALWMWVVTRERAAAQRAKSEGQRTGQEIGGRSR